MGINIFFKATDAEIKCNFCDICLKVDVLYKDNPEKQTNNTSPKRRPRRSWIWSYFYRVSNKQARCKLCKRHIRHSRSATGNLNRHLKMVHHKSTRTKKSEEFPEWASIYFVRATETEMKCNLCDICLKVDEKSLELVEHLKIDHKDIYDLHKDNPEATVGFRIEFLNLNMLKDDGDPKTQPVILGEVCEATTEPLVEKEDEITIKPDDPNMHFVILDGKKKTKRENPGPRKRSWVWKYFDKLSNIIYRCKLCNVVLSIKGCNSNNMNRHVKSRHPTVFKSEATKRERVDSAHMLTSETDPPYVIKTEEIYASDRDFEEVTESPTQKLRRSWIWSYFDRVSTTQARCKLCDRHICHGGNATGNMNRHLKMIHHKTARTRTYDQSWVWKVFEVCDTDYYTCKICQHKCMKCSDIDKSMTSILNHLKLEHGVISGDQIITGADVDGEETC